MVITQRGPALAASNLQVYHTTDHTLGNAPIVVLYGPSATSGAVSSSLTRTQCHVYTPAGFHSYPKLSISPGTPLYTAVTCLSREEQGDEVVRAMAYCLYKYFGELPEIAKKHWSDQCDARSTREDNITLFSASHAAALASRLIPADNAPRVLQQLERALATQVISHVDLDLVLPPDTIRGANDLAIVEKSVDEELQMRYGTYGPLIKLFGETLFLPTSKIQRAPSRPMAMNRTLNFAKKQKEALRRGINELVDTEENYVDKLNELLDLAVDVRAASTAKIQSSLSNEEHAIQKLFPPCLNKIQTINNGFLEAIRKIADDTEELAILDISRTPDSSTGPAHTAAVDAADPTGVSILADTLLEWLPKFGLSYSDYVYAQAEFGAIVKHSSRDADSSIGQKIQEMGEQKFLSLLIEPVQRLPRYSLYIDSISKQLPLRHPALKRLLASRDLVSAICDKNNSGTSLSCLSQIRSIVPSWPGTLRSPGRFITAVDAVEVDHVGNIDRENAKAPHLLLLLFSGGLVLLRKHGENAMTAGNFVTEVQKTSGPYLHSQMGDSGLLFLSHRSLSAYNYSQSEDGTTFSMIPTKPQMTKAMISPDDERIRSFCLIGLNEGRAERWLLDLTKARLEGRFSEAERESQCWEARIVEGGQTDLGLISAIFAEGEQERREDRGDAAAVRIVIDPGKGARKLKLGHSGVEAVVSLISEGQGFFRLEMEALGERGTRDRVTNAELLPILIKRLSHILQMRTQIRNPLITNYLLQHHTQILNTLSVVPERPDRGTTRSRNKSPSKLLSSLFANISSRDQYQATPSKDIQLATPVFNNVPRLAPHQRAKSFSSLAKPAQESFSPKRAVIVAGESSRIGGEFESLERTLTCILLALKARKGNIIGSVVARRTMADEAAVNALYNSLLENPDSHELAASSSIDLIFAAFERFMHVAWREKLGPVIPSPMLSVLQSKMGILNAFAYDEFEEQELANLAPQNRRALNAIVSTLADLLEGTRNDGDRGAITAAIAEIVVCDAEAHSFIPLFDRFVDNQESLSDRPASSGMLSVPGSVSSTMTGTTKNGSISSKASSLSKRLGFGSLRRENSKRTQKALPPDPPVEKPLFARSQSQDLDQNFSSARRPGSRDQPEGSRPDTARSDQESALLSVDSSPIKRSGATKKKRRSSLSDLTTLQTPTTSASPFWTTSASKKVEDLFQGSSSQVTPSRQGFAGCTPLKSASVRYPSPVRNENTPPLPHRAQTMKETSPSRVTTIAPSQPLFALPDPFAPARENDKPFRRSPSRREPLTERNASGNTPPPLAISPLKIQRGAKSTASSPSKRLGSQTAASLTERVRTQGASIQNTSTTLEEELAKIGRELAASDHSPSKPTSRSASGVESQQMTNLSNRLRALETRVTHLTTTLASTNDSLSKDITTSLAVAEKKARELDKQLKNANNENDVLFGRMNDELTKVFEQVRKGEGVDELKRQLRQKSEESEKWKKELMALRRENAILRGTLG